jgi:hypothetical protein
MRTSSTLPVNPTLPVGLAPSTSWVGLTVSSSRGTSPYTPLEIPTASMTSVPFINTRCRRPPTASAKCHHVPAGQVSDAHESAK